MAYLLIKISTWFMLSILCLSVMMSAFAINVEDEDDDTGNDDDAGEKSSQIENNNLLLAKALAAGPEKEPPKMDCYQCDTLKTGDKCCDSVNDDQLMSYNSDYSDELMIMFCYTLFDSVNKSRVISRGWLESPEDEGTERKSGCSEYMGEFRCICIDDRCNKENTEPANQCPDLEPHYVPPPIEDTASEDDEEQYETKKKEKEPAEDQILAAGFNPKASKNGVTSNSKTHWFMAAVMPAIVSASVLKSYF